MNFNSAAHLSQVKELIKNRSVLSKTREEQTLKENMEITVAIHQLKISFLMRKGVHRNSRVWRMRAAKK